jgi:hypothetical protein
MSLNPFGSATAAWSERAERVVREALRRFRLEATNDDTVVPAPDNTDAILAAATFLRRLSVSAGRRLLTFGTHLTGGSYDGSADVTLGTDATDAATASTLVSRDANANVSFGDHVTLGHNASGKGGNVVVVTDDGVTRWVAGVNASAGARAYNVTDVAGGVTALSVDATTHVVQLAATIDISRTGAAARSGVATLVGGTVTVNTTSVDANSFVFIQRVSAGGALGHLTYTQINGTSITINSSSATDTSTVIWWILETH